VGLITTPAEATLLARELVADIERYNDSMISTGRVPRAAIQEGRALFRARVTPGLYPLFEQALGNTALAAEAEGLADPADQGPVTDGALERAGLPTRRKVVARIVIGLLVAGFAVLVGKSVLRAHFAEVLARLPIAQVGVPAEARAALPGPATLTVAVAADVVKWSGSSCLILDVEAFRGDTRVGQVSCCGWRPRRGSTGSALIVYRTTSDCDLALPAGGADRVKVATRFSRPGALSLDGLEVRIEK
jgi:hypothetical protein